METLYRVPFLVLECPNLKLKKPPWVHMPSAMTVYALVVVSYFLITGGNSAVMGRVGAQAARSGGAWPLSPRAELGSRLCLERNGLLYARPLLREPS